MTWSIKKALFFFISQIIRLLYLPIKLLFLFLRHNSLGIKGIPCRKLLNYGN